MFLPFVYRIKAALDSSFSNLDYSPYDGMLLMHMTHSQANFLFVCFFCWAPFWFGLKSSPVSFYTCTQSLALSRLLLWFAQLVTWSVFATVGEEGKQLQAFPLCCNLCGPTHLTPPVEVQTFSQVWKQHCRTPRQTSNLLPHSKQLLDRLGGSVSDAVACTSDSSAQFQLRLKM